MATNNVMKIEAISVEKEDAILHHNFENDFIKIPMIIKNVGLTKKMFHLLLSLLFCERV